MKSNMTRRDVIGLGLAMISTAAVAAPDRPMSRGPKFLIWNHDIYCKNHGVPISDIATRIARPTDFNSLDSCALTEDKIEGPYFNCVGPGGKDITGGRDGVPLTVAMRVQDTNCRSIQGAAVDIWACDARGNYSGYTASPDVFSTTGLHVEPETEERFCRGVLATDEDGIAEFDTIYPGYYAGRAIHIHFKVHLGDKAYVTSQALMPEEVNKTVLQTPPYSDARGTRRVTNAEEADEKLSIYKVISRSDRLLAVLPVTIKT